MTTEIGRIEAGGVSAAVVRKDIKNLHLGVYPPDGHVRIAVPSLTSDAAVHAALVGKLPWIRRQQARFKRQERESARHFVSGESHWYLGRRYRLRVVEERGRPRVWQINASTLGLRCPPGSSEARRAAILERWYRDRLRELVAPLVENWLPLFGIESVEWRIRKMKTKWGSCSAVARRIWLNMELIKKPTPCLEYIVVHELAHLVERRHDAHFQTLLDGYLPRWRFLRAELGALPLAHDSWGD